MTPISIPLNPSAMRQSVLLDIAPDDHAVRIRLDLQYLPVPDKWFLSLSDGTSGDLWVNRIPLIASYQICNDLLAPFRSLNLGTLFLMPVPNTPTTPNPGRDNLAEFELVWCDLHE